MDPKNVLRQPARVKPQFCCLDDLADEPRWVAWREEHRHGQPTKVPYDPNGRLARIPTDPSTWSTRPNAERRWKKLDNGASGGIGLVLGDLRNGTHLLGLDLDRCIVKDKLDQHADEIIERFNSYCEVSPSGRGVKLFFLVASEQMPAVWDLLGRNGDGKPKRRMSFVADQHREIAIDWARYYTVTEDCLNGTPSTFRVVDIEDVRWLIEEVGPRFMAEHGKGADRGADRGGGRDESGSGCGFRFMRDRRAAGDDYEAARAAILEDAGKAGEWARRVDERQLQRAWDAAEQHEDKKKQKQIDVLVEAARTSGGLFHDANDVAYADLIIDGHRETWPVKSQHFKGWLTRLFYEKMKTAPSSEALSSGLRLIEAMACFEGQQHEVHLRSAPGPEGIWIDLCDKAWRAIWISADGWSVVNDPQIKFIRRKGMRELPVPVEGGSVEELRPFVNVKSPSDFVLVVSWLLAAFRPKGPYPVLAVYGEAGAAKSTLLLILRALIDPATAGLRAPPRENRDLFIAASNSWVVCFDNVSSLPDWISDSLARLATGGGFGTRQLYSDDEERLFDLTRPVLLGAVENVIMRGDLASRAMLVQLGYIDDAKRRTEEELWAAFRAVQPRIFGAMLTAVANGLKALPSVKLTHKPRMADFATFATACEAGLWEAGTFMAAYTANLRDAGGDVVEASMVGTALQALMREYDEWIGTATQLLTALNEKVTDQQRKDKHWPKKPNHLSGAITRLAPELRKLGIEVSDGGRTKKTNRRLIRLTRLDARNRKVPEGSLAPLGSLFPNDANDLGPNGRGGRTVKGIVKSRNR